MKVMKQIKMTSTDWSVYDILQYICNQSIKDLLFNKKYQNQSILSSYLNFPTQTKAYISTRCVYILKYIESCRLIMV